MQLRASRRQTSVQDPGLRPHEVLARRWALQRRLVIGGVLALALSVLAWLLGVPLPVHLGLVGVGFVVGFFWRFASLGRRAERWAFAWIEARAGLSYLTAYELAQADPETTESAAAGFGEAVRARAAQVGRLETPALQPWALPLIVLALALAALPHLVLPTWRAPLAPLTERLPLSTPQTDPPTPEEAFAAAPEPETGTTPTDAPETGTETGQKGSANRTGDTGTDSPDAGASFDDAAAPSEGSAAEGERAALEDFLEQSGAAQTGAAPGTREGAPQGDLSQTNPPQNVASPTATPPEVSQSTTPRAAAPEGSGDQAQRGQRPSQEAGAAQPNADNTPSDQGGATAPGEGSPVGRESGTNSDPGQNAGQTEAGKKAEASGNADEGAQESSSQDARTSQAQNGSQPSDSQQEQSGTGDAAQNNSASSQASSNGQRSAAPDAGSQASTDPTDGASSNRAGNRAGGEISSSRERLGNASPQTPERVTGLRRDGPLSFAGETLRQGDAPDALPQTGSAEYRRAAEEVIREGRIPLEYQEIVRDYFR